MDWVRNVLELLAAKRLVATDELILNLFVDAAGDQNAAGFGHRLEASRDIDAIAVDRSVRIHDDITKVDAYSVL
jgi:hypothetical protein